MPSSRAPSLSTEARVTLLAPKSLRRCVVACVVASDASRVRTYRMYTFFCAASSTSLRSLCFRQPWRRTRDIERSRSISRRPGSSTPAFLASLSAWRTVPGNTTRARSESSTPTVISASSPRFVSSKAYSASKTTPGTAISRAVPWVPSYPTHLIEGSTAFQRGKTA